MAGSFFARRKMVVIPTFGRDKQASRLPIDAHHFVFSAGIPHHRIALTGDDDDLSTRPVPGPVWVWWPLIGRRGKKPPRLPLQCNRILAFIGPELRRAAARKNQDLFFIHMTNRLETLACWNLPNHHADEALGTFEMTIS